MDYDGRFIMQKTMVSTNRPVDWSLLRSTSGRLLTKERKNPHFNRMNQRSTTEGKVKSQCEFQNGEVLRLKLYEHLKI